MTTRSEANERFAREFQVAAKSLGLYHGSIDGWAGPQTIEALKAMAVVSTIDHHEFPVVGMPPGYGSVRNAYSLALRYLGVKEVAGPVSNPLIVAMMRLDAAWVEDDETPWCSAFCNFIAWNLRLQRSHSLAARSWLAVGEPVDLDQARSGFDVVVFKRGGGHQPGPEVLEAPGHVGFFDALLSDGRVRCLGGNQGDAVSIASFPGDRVLGVRRMGPDIGQSIS